MVVCLRDAVTHFVLFLNINTTKTGVLAVMGSIEYFETIGKEQRRNFLRKRKDAGTREGLTSIGSMSLLLIQHGAKRRVDTIGPVFFLLV